MPQYVVRLGEFGTTTVQLDGHYTWDLVAIAARKLGIPARVPRSYLVSLASIRKVGGSGAGRRKNILF